jgi:hypothetical protein
MKGEESDEIRKCSNCSKILGPKYPLSTCNSCLDVYEAEAKRYFPQKEEPVNKK